MTAPVYITLAQVKAYWPTNEVSTTSVWDAMITTLCTNVSRAFDSLTFRSPGDYAVTADDTRLYNGRPRMATDNLSSLYIDEITALPTSVSVSQNGDPSLFVTLLTTDYFLWPYNAISKGKPYERIDLNLASGTIRRWPFAPRSVQIIGKFGYSQSVPADVFEALLLFVIKLVRKGQQNYLDTGTILDTGQIMAGMKIDYDLKALLKYYERWRDAQSEG